MGVDIRVMPFSRWTSMAGWLDRFKAGLAKRGVEGDWDESAELLAAVTFSYHGFARIGDAAGRLAGRVRWAQIADPFQPFWVPLRFHAPLEIPDPAGGDEPVTVVSAVAALEELARLRDLTEGEDQELVEALRRVVETAVRARVPMLVEG
jgi:hypothetical protein